MRRSVALLAAPAALLALAGCLGEPDISERWTLLEILDASPTQPDGYAPGGATPVTVTARITYREVLTGFLVADLRASDTLTPADVALDADAPLDVARDVDRVLENSISLGAQAVPITGWDHLIQEVPFSFAGGVPAPTVADSSVASAATTPVNAAGVFLLLYFADDVEQVELASGEEIDVIHPTFSTERNVLSAGIEIGP
jgi:hypothetical protein